MAIAGAVATTTATIDSSNSNISSKAGTPFCRRRNLVSKKKNYGGPTQPPQTPDDHGSYGGGYPRVNIKNNSNHAASGQVLYSLIDVQPTWFHVNPGETWTAPYDRGINLVTCIMANLDVPIPLNIADDYQSTGTSYAAFEITFSHIECKYLVHRLGDITHTKPPFANCETMMKHRCESTTYVHHECPERDPESCTDYPWRTYHEVWPPVNGLCHETSMPTVQPVTSPPSLQPTENPTVRTIACPSGSYESQPWNDCSQFYSCDNGTSGPVQDCPSDLLFNTDNGYVRL